MTYYQIQLPVPHDFQDKTKVEKLKILREQLEYVSRELYAEINENTVKKKVGF